MRTYPDNEIEELRPYCRALSLASEGEVPFFHLEALRLPYGCSPSTCDALLCPVDRDGYPSRLYLSSRVQSPFTAGWNINNARILERDWFVYSWRITLPNPTLADMLRGHLTGFTRPK